MLRKEQIAKAFYLEARTDMKMAELAHDNGIYSRCVSMSQQVVEKMLKSALAMVGFYGLKKHEMLQYFTEEYNKILAEDPMNKIVRLVRPLEAEWIRSRYPDWTDQLSLSGHHQSSIMRTMPKKHCPGLKKFTN